MGKSLVIVESPAKAKTLKKFLGKSFLIKSSVGHLIDLPKKSLGVDIENNFKPSYVTIKGKDKILKELKDTAATADDIYLAPDPDREGEAIAWHIANELKEKAKGKIYRVLFNAITKNAVTEAVKNPGEIDKNKVDAQQTRRILDRLVGYKISPILWKKVRRGLSAGRVQSVAVRLICEREKEIEAFVQEEYWNIKADLRGKNPPPFEAMLFRIFGKKPKISTNEEAGKILKDLNGADYKIEKIQKKERRRNPVPPFITSTLQQEASRKLRFTAKRTMSIAQRLYEGLNIGEEGHIGLITYMRTDSTRIVPEAISEVREYIKNKYGDKYLPASPNIYKSKKAAQDAHEAVRPTSVIREPSSIERYLSKEENNLYRLIWNRFVASQMSKAVLDTTSIDIQAKQYTFRSTGSVVKFMGFMQIYTESKDEEKTGYIPKSDKALKGKNETFLPDLKEGEIVELIKIDKSQHFTQPPPRYSEATLIKELEENGVGRPSTYASIMSVIRSRDYVISENGKFIPSELGLLINNLLVENFPKVLNVEFTAHMENQLDQIEEGEKGWVETLRDFYQPFEANLINAASHMRNVKAEIEATDKICEKCGGQMGIRWGRFGKFLACMNYPDCKNTKEIKQASNGKVEIEKQEESNETCDICGNPMLVKSGKFGKFLACSKYPECKFTKSISTGVGCPECNGYIGIHHSKRGKTFYGCSNYPECKFAMWNRPVPEKCPECDYTFLVEKWSKKGRVVQCGKKGCAYRKVEEEKAEAA